MSYNIDCSLIIGTRVRRNRIGRYSSTVLPRTAAASPPTEPPTTSTRASLRAAEAGATWSVKRLGAYKVALPSVPGPRQLLPQLMSRMKA